MIMIEKYFFTDSKNQNWVRLMTWNDQLIPGNYTIVVNITNSALVEKTFFINILIPVVV